MGRTHREGRSAFGRAKKERWIIAAFTNEGKLALFCSTPILIAVIRLG